MKRFMLSLCAFALLVPSLLAAPPESKAQADFDRLKSLAGSWEGQTPDGMKAQFTYAVVSAGSTVMETIDHEHMKGSMVTMYHLAGDRLMMTHYCSAGNQPRMRLVSSTKSGLTFEMFDATNLKSGDDPHMRKVVITWADKGHITEDWTMSKDGKDQPHGVFTLERK